MLSELQLLIAKEADLQSKIAKIENGDPDALYIDRVVEMRAPKSTERLEQQQEKLETLRRKRDDLTWEIDSGPMVSRRQRQSKSNWTHYNAK